MGLLRKILTHVGCILVWVLTMLVLLAGIKWAWSLL